MAERRLSERTRLEQERGRIIGQRKLRERDLERYVAGKKVQVIYTNDPAAGTGHTAKRPTDTMACFIVNGVECCRESILGDDYPSERVMATINLAVACTVGTEGIPPVMDDSPEAVAARARRDTHRDQFLGQWRRNFDPDDPDYRGGKRAKP